MRVAVLLLALYVVFDAFDDRNSRAEVAVLHERVYGLTSRVQLLEGVDIDKAVKIGPPEVVE